MPDLHDTTNPHGHRRIDQPAPDADEGDTRDRLHVATLQASGVL